MLKAGCSRLWGITKTVRTFGQITHRRVEDAQKEVDMKLQSIVKATVYKLKMNTMTPKDGGNDINWYQVILDQNEEVGTFTCSEDVYLNARCGEECELYAEYDDQNKRFKITGVVPNTAAQDCPATSVPVADHPADTPAPAADQSGKKAKTK